MTTGPNDENKRVDPVLNPVYLLRAYAWAVLKANMPATWIESKYGGKVPVVPLAEEPELSEYSGPHIVYGYAFDGSSDLFARKSGSLTFAVYDSNFRRLTQTMTVLETAFGRFDESARDINNYTSAQGASFLGLTFAYTSIGFLEGGTPEEAEAGRQSALINVRFEYHVDYNIVTNVL